MEMQIGSVAPKAAGSLPQTDVFTVAVGGAAGDGIREAASNVAQLVAMLGFEAFMSFKYPSLIRGGHNFGRISFSKEKVWNDHEETDLLVAFNEESVRLHMHELTPNAFVLAESFGEEEEKALGKRAIRLPMTAMAKDLKAPLIMRSSAALGACAYLLDLPLAKMNDVLRRVFTDKGAEANIAMADKGYEFATKLGIRHGGMILSAGGGKEMVEGNIAFARGMLAAGLDLYLAYPMTPATSILNYLAREQYRAGIKVFQPENELAVINMALGAAYAGKRVAVGSATGGFALMSEALSHAGIAEIPVVIAVSQRQGPATGIPTRSSQADLRFVLHAGHGEFPKLVVAPGDPEEAFAAGAHALQLAWKYQIPALVLLDKHVSENSMTSVLDAKKIAKAEAKMEKNPDGRYVRYAFAQDGVSPLLFPGTPGADVKETSYEHDEHGIATEDAATVQLMQEKRYMKWNGLESEMSTHETVKVYGDSASDTAIVFWGSTKTPVLEAMKYITKPVKLVQILWMCPFDSEKVERELKGARRIIDIEDNRTGQLASLIREKTGIAATDKILRYDSKPFVPVALANAINSLMA